MRALIILADAAVLTGSERRVAVLGALPALTHELVQLVIASRRLALAGEPEAEVDTENSHN